MTIDAKEIVWPDITPKGVAILKEIVNRQYSNYPNKYVAPYTSLPFSKPEPDLRYRLLDIFTVAKAEPMKWRIKGILPECGLGAIYGPSGSGKSFLVLDMLMNIAKGESWFSHRTKPCPIVYLCLEGEAGLSSRVAAYCKANPCSDRNTFFMNQPFNLFKPKDVLDLVKAIKFQNANNGILVIDTLNRAIPGIDENSSSDMGKAIDYLKQIQREIGGQVIVIHHTGKDTAKGLRGHSSLIAALDVSIEVRRSGDLREWKLAKAKDGEDGTLHSFRLDTIDIDIPDEDGEPIYSCVVRPTAREKIAKPLTPNQQLGMDTFYVAASVNIDSSDNRVHAHLNQWREEFNRVSTAETKGGKRSNFSRVRNELVQLRKLVCEKDVYSLPAGFKSIEASHESRASQ